MESGGTIRMVEEGKDVLPIDASFRIVRKQQARSRISVSELTVVLPARSLM